MVKNKQINQWNIECIDQLSQDIINNSFQVLREGCDIIECINRMLSYCGQKLQLDRVRLYMVTSRDYTLFTSYEWDRQKGNSITRDNLMPVERFYDYLKQFDQDDFYQYHDKMVDNPYLRFFQKIGMKAILQHRVYQDQKAMGCISFEQADDYLWSEEEYICLETLSIIFTSMFLRLEANYSVQYKLNKLRNFDALTKVASFHKFKKDLKQQLKNKPATTFVILYFDIDNFKYINEAFGELVGDQILIDFANHLLKVYGSENTVARVGADKFVTYRRTCSEKELLHLVDKSNEDFCSQMRKKFISNKLQISTGISYVTSQDDLSVAIDNANAARKKIKANAKESVLIFDQEIRDQIYKELEIANTMEEALRKGEFIIYLQPKIDLFTNTVVGAEALVRWKKNELNILGPNEFIPILEKNGFILNMDYYVYEQVCILLSKWKETGRKLIPISVNVSPVHINDSNFVSDIVNLVKKYEIAPQLIELELTESIFIKDTELALQTLKELRSYGFVVSIDDFGSGYSSLNMLKDITTDVIKLDKEFFGKGTMNQAQQIIISSIIQMAKQLNMKVLSEGIETDVQSEFIKNNHCDMAQGFYFSRPLPLEEFERLY